MDNDFSNLQRLKGINRPLLNLLDGSIVFRFSYEESSLLIKMDKDSNVEWVISDEEYKEFTNFHHDYNLDSNGNIFSPVVIKKKGTGFEVLNKTIMRNPDFKTSNKDMIYSLWIHIIHIVSECKLNKANFDGLYIWNIIWGN